jgi:hypothetical protein
MIPLIFITLFFLGNVIAGDMNVAIELYIKNTDDMKLTYTINGIEKDVSITSISSDVGDKKILTYKVPNNDSGIYKIYFGNNTERISLANIKFSTFFSERVVEAEELSAFFTEKSNLTSMLYSGGLYILEEPASGATINNIDPIKPLPSKLFSIILLGLVSFILAIILSGLLKRFIYGFLLGKSNPNFKIGTTQFVSGIATALVVIFSVSVLAIGGTPNITFDEKGIMKEPPEKSTQTLKDLLQKKADEDAAAQANKPVEDEADYVIEPIPLKRDIPFDANAECNIPNCKMEDIYEGNFPVENVLIGKTDKDGNIWTFFNGDENDNTITDYTGQTTFTEAQLKKITTNFVNQAKWLADQDMKFYIVIPPNKNTIYPEYMPESITRTTTSRMDILINYIKEHTDLVVIDVREDLLKAKQDFPDEYLYYNFDTHWNNHGGFVAYKKIVETLKIDFPTIPVMQKSDYQIDYFPAYMKDMPWYLGYYDTFGAEGPVYTRKTKSTAILDTIDAATDPGGIFYFTNPLPDGYHDLSWYSKFVNSGASDAPKLYMIRDSFSISMIPFFKESFSECSFRWTTDFDKDQVLENDPDIVIFEMVERKLGELLRKNVFRG